MSTQFWKAQADMTGCKRQGADLCSGSEQSDGGGRQKNIRMRQDFEAG